ncbi:MAG: Gfo/Idh/MocA family protein [Blastocatellia bacterium]
MSNTTTTSRRNFLKLAGAATVAAKVTTQVLAAEALEQGRKISANDRIRLATIGIGEMGTGDTKTALSVPGVELVAVADLYDGRLIRAKEVFGDHLFTTRDYREILARPDVDAVIIATPDHWHSRIAIDAMRAGKDVYCEKPMVQLLDEGQPVIEAQNQTKRIMTVGSQFTSSIVMRKAKELLDSGAIGELNLVESNLSRRSPQGAWQYTIPPDASPRTIDWDRFLGRAPKREFDPVRFFRWRNYQDYGTGIGGDLFVHQFTSLHYITGSKGPARVMATGGLRYWKDGRDVPDVLIGVYDYATTGALPAFNVIFRVNFIDGGVDESGSGWNYRFIGSEGTMTIGNGVTLARRPVSKEPGYNIDSFPKAVQEEFLKEYRAQYPAPEPALKTVTDERFVPPPGYRERLDHFRNFFAAMRSRQPVFHDAVYGFRAAAPALLTNLSYFERRSVEWNPETMQPA